MTAGPTTAPAPAAPAPAGPTPQPAPGPTVDVTEGDSPQFEIRFGSTTISVPLEGDAAGRQLTVDLTERNVGVPGLRLDRVVFRMADGAPASGTLYGTVRAPFVTGEVELTVDAEGTVSGSTRLDTQVAILGNPAVEFSYVDESFGGSITVEGQDLAQRLPIPQVTLESGRATVAFAAGTLTGSLSATFSHATLGRGDINVTLGNDGVTGSGGFTLNVPVLDETRGTFEYSGTSMSATVDLSAGQVGNPLPGLTLSNLNGQLRVSDGSISGSFGLTGTYAGLASVTLSDVGFGPQGFTGGRGSIQGIAPLISGMSGDLAVSSAGRVTGAITLGASDLPFPVQRASVRIGLREDGGLDVTGSGTVSIGSVVSGDLTVGWVNETLVLGTDVRVTIPPLPETRGRLEYANGQLSGEIQTTVAIGPLQGNVLVRYRDGMLSGEGRIDYAMGRFNGWVLLRLGDDGRLSGEGEATFQLASWLTATIGLAVDPDLNVDVRGELVFPDAITLFDAWEYERNFFSYNQQFPLWGITIPVVGSIGLIAEIGASAGFRARFGPGTLRNIRAVGEVSTRPDVEPSFEISGDFHVPAGAEVVLSLHGGIGLAALVASITGGIELSGIAGVYGAITLTPTFAYRDGEYHLNGRALLEAAAQLGARINAYASVVAGIGWLSGEVWRKDWNLAEWRFDTGWNIGLAANIAYTLGQPFVPEVSLEEVAVDPDSIIKGAIPNSGDPVPAPARPATPSSSFTATEGQAGAVGSEPAAPGPGQGTPPPTSGGAPPATTQQGPQAAPTSAAATAAPAGSAAPLPTMPRPAELGRARNDRTADEQFRVYLFDQLSPVLRKKKPDAEAEADIEEQVEKAEEQGARALPGQEPSVGRPLPPSTRDRMERVLGEDLSDVRIHTDPAAAGTAEALGAEAFTVGNDVYFGAGATPETGDEALLAHELVHVIQQPAAAPEVSEPTDELEEEAEEAAEKVKRGEPVKPIRRRSEAAGIHRTAAPAAGGAASPVDVWRDMTAQLVANPSAYTEQIRARMRALLDERTFKGSLEDGKKVYDDATDRFLEDPYEIMWPAHRSLSHKNVFGGTQIGVGDQLFKAPGTREPDSATTNQSAMARLIRQSGEAGRAAIVAGQQPGEFFPQRETERQMRGDLDYQDAWNHYEATSAKQFHKPAVENRPASTRSGVNLNLSPTGFAAMWAQGYRWRMAGHWLQRTDPGPVPTAPQEPPAATPAPGAAAPAAPDVMRTVFVNDYEAHHVIPLWLRSASGKADGDRWENLVPWHRSAHQSNHATQQRIPAAHKLLRETPPVSLWNHLPDGTRFVVSEASGGAASPEPPKLEVDEQRTTFRERADKAPWW